MVRSSQLLIPLKRPLSLHSINPLITNQTKAEDKFIIDSGSHHMVFSPSLLKDICPLSSKETVHPFPTPWLARFNLVELGLKSLSCPRLVILVCSTPSRYR